MRIQKAVDLDLDYQGDTFDKRAGGGLVSFRRHGNEILLRVASGINQVSLWISANQAESMATNLLAAAESARSTDRDATGRLFGCPCGLTGSLDNPAVVEPESGCPHHGVLVDTGSNPG